MEELLKILIEEMRISNKLSALAITKEMKAEAQVEVLTKAGLKPRDIAEVLGKTPNYVSVTLHKLRTKKKAND